MSRDITDIFETEYQFVLNYCRKRVDNWHVAEDLASATFETALRLLPHNDPRSLLVSIARYKVLQYFQTNRRRRTWSFADVFELTHEDYHAALESDGEIDRVVEACDTATRVALLRATLTTCSRADLRIIHLRYIQGLSAKEVAARLGMSPDLYNKHQARVLASLAKRLARRLDPEPTKQTRMTGDAPATCQECGAPHYLRGLCRSHYNKLRRRERQQARARLAKLLL